MQQRLSKLALLLAPAIVRETGFLGFRRWGTGQRHWSTHTPTPTLNMVPGPSLHGGWLLPACTEHRRLLRSYGFKVNVNIK